MSNRGDRDTGEVGGIFEGREALFFAPEFAPEP